MGQIVQLHPRDYGPSYCIADTTLPVFDATADDDDMLGRAAKHYPRVARRAKLWRTLRSLIDGDGFFLVTGALIAADPCLCIYLAGGGR